MRFLKVFIIMIALVNVVEAAGALRCTWLETKAAALSELTISQEYSSRETMCKYANQFIEYAEEYLRECGGRSNFGEQGTVGKIKNNMSIAREKCRGYTKKISDDVKNWFKSDDKDSSSSIEIPKETSTANTTSKCLRYRVTAKMLNVRNMPSKEGVIQGRYKRGEICVLAIENGWAYTPHGWISAKYIEPIIEAQSLQSKQYYKVVNIRSDDTLSVRTGPGTEYQKIGDLPYNAVNVQLGSCKYSSNGGLWCQVKYKNIDGWSSVKYLQEDHYQKPVDNTLKDKCEEYNYAFEGSAGGKTYEEDISLARKELETITKQYQECKGTSYELSDKVYSQLKSDLEKRLKTTKQEWKTENKIQLINKTGAARDHWTGWGPDGTLPGPDFKP